MLPYLINFDWIKISAFGTFFALAFMVGLFISWREARDKGLADDRFFDASLVTVILSLAGARIFYILSHWPDFANNLLKTFVIWRYPGLSFWGALVTGLTTGFILAKKHRLSLLKFADSLAVGGLYAYFILYIGMFLDGSITGRETNLSVGWYNVGVEGKRHLVALYGAILALIIILGQVFVKRRKVKPKPGIVFWVTLSAIGFAEFLLAFLRENLLYWGGLSIQLVLATVLLIVPWGPLFVMWDGKNALISLFQSGKNTTGNFLRRIFKK